MTFPIVYHKVILERFATENEEHFDVTFFGDAVGFLRLLLREICYIEVRGHKLIFHTETGSVSRGGAAFSFKAVQNIIYAILGI